MSSTFVFEIHIKAYNVLCGCIFDLTYLIFALTPQLILLSEAWELLSKRGTAELEDTCITG